jgi:putative protein-disulfide isomerase
MTGTISKSRHLLYVADPMCSWCWGFAPVISALADACAGRAQVRLVMGGLRAGETRPLSARAKAEIRLHWEAVRATTGQPFEFAFFDRDAFVYDTAPACRAVVVVRSLLPDRTLDYFTAIQRAFYVENRDVTAVATLAELARPFGIDPDEFARRFAEPAAAEAMRAHLRLKDTLAVAGFPTVILHDEGGFTGLTTGYQPLEDLLPALERWLAA